MRAACGAARDGADEATAGLGADETRRVPRAEFEAWHAAGCGRGAGLALGVGRPSPYGMVLRVLKDREYAAAVSRQLSPKPRGLLVNALLVQQLLVARPLRGLLLPHDLEVLLEPRLELEAVDRLAALALHVREGRRPILKVILLNVQLVIRVELMRGQQGVGILEASSS